MFVPVFNGVDYEKDCITFICCCYVERWSGRSKYTADISDDGSVCTENLIRIDWRIELPNVSAQ